MNDFMGGRRAGLAQALMNRRMGGRGGAYPHGMPHSYNQNVQQTNQSMQQAISGLAPQSQYGAVSQAMAQQMPGIANGYRGMGSRDRGGPMMSPPNEMQNEVNPMTGSVRAQQMFPNGIGLQKPNDVAMTPGINPMAKPLMSNAMKRPPAYTQPGIPVMPANDLA